MKRFLIACFNYFVKITGLIPYLIIANVKVYYEDKKAQGKKLKGKTIIMSNHTSVYDYAVYLFVFFFKTLRFQMAEVLFNKNIFLKVFLKALGGIRVNRDLSDFSFIDKSKKVLDKGGVVGVFPESRLRKEGEDDLLDFKPSITYLALESGAKIVPVYTKGNYFAKGRSKIIIGKEIDVLDYIDTNKTDKENIDIITKILREKIKELGKMLDEKS